MDSRTRPTRVAVLVMAAALVVAACGDDDDQDSSASTGASATTAAGAATTGGPAGSGGPTSAGGATTVGAATTTAADEADIDRSGVLRIAQNLQAGMHLDPIAAVSPADFHVHYHIYDTLLRQNEDGSYRPGLAKSATVVDPQTIEVVLQDGVTMQDGTPFTADDVKFTIERNIASNKVAPFRISDLGAVDNIEITSPTAFTIHLKTPTAGSFYNLLAQNETMPVSMEAVQAGTDLNANPVGAGPFKFVSQDDQKIVLEKWDDYFQADEIKLAGTEWVHVTPGSNNIALNSGAVDVAVTTIDENQTELKNSGLDLRTVADQNNVLWLGMLCEVNPALGDVRVRQALNFATDKEAVKTTLQYGNGTVMSQFWTPDSEFYNRAIEHAYDYSPDRAMQLLADAGYPDLTLKIIVTPGFLQRLAEILQGQWAKSGINLELVPSTNTVQDFYFDHKADLYAQAQDRFWTDKITRTFVPGSIGTTCQPKDPTFLGKVLELRGYDPDDPAAVQAWFDAQKILSDEAMGVWIINGTTNNAWNGDRVADMAWTPNQLGTMFPDVHAVYIKK